MEREAGRVGGPKFSKHKNLAIPGRTEEKLKS
jgi:hypothetical protein